MPQDEDQVVDGDAAVVAGDDAPSVRQPLDRRRIVAAAVGYIDELGLAGLFNVPRAEARRGAERHVLETSV